MHVVLVHFRLDSLTARSLTHLYGYGHEPSRFPLAAAAFGDGVYFAIDSSYSASSNYSKPNANGVKQMFYARELVGESTLGRTGLRFLPAKSPTSNEKFDSATNHLQNPIMYVIFSDTQAYPEFLIEFK